jgi:DNA repair protein RecO (recombination protein O)
MIKTRAFVFRSIKTKDNTYVVKLYTEELGLISFIIIISQSKGKIKSSYLQPLTMLELSFDYHQNKEIQRVSDISIHQQFLNISNSVVKQSVLYFLNEVLTKSIKEEERNPRLFQFIFDSIQQLDTEDSYFYFTLQFLIELSIHLGIYPENNFSRVHNIFSLDEGRFIDSPKVGSKCVNEHESEALSELLNNNFNLQITKVTRNRLVEILLNYFDEHIPEFGQLKSMQVLAEVFE